MGPTNGETAREDLGYQNTPEKLSKYRINKELQMSSDSNNSQEPLPQALCRVKFKYGIMAGEIKRLSWKFAEPLLKHGKAEWVGWVDA